MIEIKKGQFEKEHYLADGTEFKVTRKEMIEVIADSLDNMTKEEIKNIIKDMADKTCFNKNVFKYLAKNHEDILQDALIYNGIIEEE